MATVGFGDVVVETEPGRLVTIIFSFISILIVALPIGIISGSYVEEHELYNQKNKN